LSILPDTETATISNHGEQNTSDVNKASGSKAERYKTKDKNLIFKAKDTTFKAKATNYRKKQHLLSKQSTALHYGNADAMLNVSRCILKNV